MLLILDSTPVLPVIAGFSPASGPVATVIRVALQSGGVGVTAAAIGGTAANFVVESDTVVRVTVPTGASSGLISLTNAAGSALSATEFTVSAPPVDLSGATDGQLLRRQSGAIAGVGVGTGLEIVSGALRWITQRLDQLATPTNSVDFGGQKAVGLGTPTASTDAATKAYVDAVVGGGSGGGGIITPRQGLSRVKPLGASSVATLATVNSTLNSQWFFPFSVSRTVSIDRLIYGQTTNATPMGILFSFYDSQFDSPNGLDLPGNLLLSHDFSLISNQGNSNVLVTLSSSLTLSSGQLYWASVLVRAASLTWRAVPLAALYPALGYSVSGSAAVSMLSLARTAPVTPVPTFPTTGYGTLATAIPFLGLPQSY